MGLSKKDLKVIREALIKRQQTFWERSVRVQDPSLKKSLQATANDANSLILKVSEEIDRLILIEIGSDAIEGKICNSCGKEFKKAVGRIRYCQKCLEEK